jgi:hypothetical protein
MSADAVIFEDISRTYCYFDRAVNLSGILYAEVSDSDLRDVLHAIERVLRHDCNGDRPRSRATAMGIRALAMGFLEGTPEHDYHMYWLRKVIAYADAHPQGRFHIKTDHDLAYWPDIAEAGGYEAWTTAMFPE